MGDGGGRSGMDSEELERMKRGTPSGLVAMGWRVSLHSFKRQGGANSLMRGEANLQCREWGGLGAGISGGDRREGVEHRGERLAERAGVLQYGLCGPKSRAQVEKRP